MTLDPVDFQPNENLDESDLQSKFSDKFQRAALKSLLIAKDKQGDARKMLKDDTLREDDSYFLDFRQKLREFALDYAGLE